MATSKVKSVKKRELKKEDKVSCCGTSLAKHIKKIKKASTI